ncbi:NAD(P)/FAD-dependent oxidoreductase [Anaerosolibacter sp.]|uniref:NAD(P)/FAD-dependent oxidoreductase n=1 Tax=Anaerosolibacter sp. TaxID=1872527 RepID=UPI0039EF4C39
MKVAIMGAGLSGLSCALTLERHGKDVTIFESRNQVGDRFVNGEILLSILERPVYDCIAYLAEKHDIFLHPVSNIAELILYGEKEKAVITGFLGFTNIRGRHEDSFEKQLARQVRSKIIYNSDYTYNQLMKEFTHVVMATGDGEYVMKLGNYQKDLSVTLKGATIEGNFKAQSVTAWLNNDFAPKGYAYLIPFSDREANIVIAYPDYPDNIGKNIDILWEKFYQEVCTKLNQELRVTDRFEISRYIIGSCQQARIGNTLFTGNCFGSIMPFLGFGQWMAILTGIYAAHDLCGWEQYEELVKPLRKGYNNSLMLRRGMEKADNPKLDFIVKALSGRIGQKLFNSGHHDPLRFASYLLRPFV